LTAADVLEKGASSLKCVGGTFGSTQQPTKFLCLVLKLLQLQPEEDLIRTFVMQDHFKYVRALGAFYIRMTSRPADIYELLEPLYGDHSKLKYRKTSEWRLLYMDELAHELLTTSNVFGITLPRLPMRETLQEEGFLDDGPRPTALQEEIDKAGGLEEYLYFKMKAGNSQAAIDLYERRQSSKKGPSNMKVVELPTMGEMVDVDANDPMEIEASKKRSLTEREKKRKSKDKNLKKSKKAKYGSLFKDSGEKIANGERSAGVASDSSQKKQQDECSEEYWNEERAKLGLKPLNSK
jgi:pre-mRNA-splicing factor 38A